ncbi:MAG: hypothetical protein DHS20C14_06880 [Phycisphaeraceae bacterium]|nr:MAG: hypothetical protein DHS20C14_06880 [Phycisphaeraceae bacterium]
MPPILPNMPERALIGMVHVGALPGTPNAAASVEQLAETAVSEALQLTRAGFDALIVENMHDAPYVHGHLLGPEITATMTRVLTAVIDAVSVPVGGQILSGGNRHSLAACHATGGAFIRCENFVFSHVADEGLLPEAEAGPLLRYRRSIGAEGVRVFCDIKKKHASHAITADVSLADAAHAAQFFGSDGLIVTGTATGKATSVHDVAEVRAATDLPVLVGSGVTPESAAALLEHADALIVGSSIKQGGVWSNPVDPGRAEHVVRAARASG